MFLQVTLVARRRFGIEFRDVSDVIMNAIVDHELEPPHYFAWEI